jgi:hypothetical protein
VKSLKFLPVTSQKIYVNSALGLLHYVGASNAADALKSPPLGSSTITWFNNTRTEQTSIINHHESLESVNKFY